MKWIRRVLVAIAILACGVLVVAFLTALRTEHPVGFQVARATGSDGQHVPGRRVVSDASASPADDVAGSPAAGCGARRSDLGSRLAARRDLARQRRRAGQPRGPGPCPCRAGYVVAAPMHAGDNYADQSAAGSASLYSGRNRQLHDTIDYMLGDWQGHDRIDPERIGAFGMSAGGFTVLTAVGAQPDLRLVASHCAESPEFVCEVLGHARSPLLLADTPNVGGVFLADARIKAAVVAAPGLGFSFGPNGLANVRCRFSSGAPTRTTTSRMRRMPG